RIAENWMESGNYPAAIAALTASRPSGAVGQSSAKLRDRTELLAEARTMSGDRERARQMFTELLDQMPNPAQPDNAAQAAARNLDLLDVGTEQFGRKVADLPEAEHLRRAGVYQFVRDFA